MLIEYTPLSSLSPHELELLKATVKNMTLEGVNTPYITFNGRIFSVNEIFTHKSEWEGTGPRQPLME